MKKKLSPELSNLSPLENRVLGVLWKAGEGMRARDIFARLRSAPLTSIAVTLGRLHEKGVVVRASEKGRGGTRYIYSAIPKESFQRSMVAGIADMLVANFGSIAVNYFNEKYGKKNNPKRD